MTSTADNTLLQELRYTFRQLRRSRGFALLTVSILSVGLGLNAAIFTVVDCVLLRPLGYHDADRIVSIRTRYPQQDHVNPRVGGGDYVDASRGLRGIESAAYYQNWDAAVQVRGQAAIVPTAYVSPRFGEVLGVTPLAGRLFAQDDAAGTAALVSASFARNHFGSAQAALQQSILGENGLYQVVGVLPDGFSFPEKTAVWFEADPTPRILSRSAYNQKMVAKRRTGTTQQQLDAELAVFSQALQQANAEDRLKVLIAVPLQESIVGSVAPTLRLLMGAVAIILLIVIANITHLQLVRATRQRHEIAVRTSLGASRARLVLSALIEVIILSGAGCLGALLLAYPALRVLVHLAPSTLPRLNEVALNDRVLLISVLISVAAMAVTALLPVWRAWHVDQSLVLRQDSTRGAEGRSAVRLRQAFLISEIAFTLMLAAAAVLLMRQLSAQTREDLGFNMERLYTLDSSTVEPTKAPLPAPAGTPAAKLEAEVAEINASALRLARLNSALDALRAIPGVTAAEAISGAPLGFGGSDVGYAIRGRSVFQPPYKDLPSAELRPMTPGALALMGASLLRGRALTQGDTYTTPHVLLINRTLADQQFHGDDAVGKQIMCGYDEENTWWTIVGVVSDVKDTPGQPALATFYIPVAQHPGIAGSMQLLVRTAPGSGLSEEALRQHLQRTHPEIAAKATTMAQNFSEVERDLRFRTTLFESFAAVSVLLAMLGMYGATAYSVAQRTFEFGVRMALGSTRAQVVATVLRQSLWTAAAGVVAGIALYALLLRAFTTLIGNLPTDPAALAFASSGVLLLSVLACALPAHRASTIDPMRALRTE